MNAIIPLPQAESALETGGYAKGVAIALITRIRTPRGSDG